MNEKEKKLKRKETPTSALCQLQIFGLAGEKERKNKTNNNNGLCFFTFMLRTDFLLSVVNNKFIELKQRATANEF